MDSRVSFEEWTKQLRHTLYKPTDYIDYTEIQKKCNSDLIAYLNRWSEKKFTKSEFVKICNEYPSFLEFSMMLFTTRFKERDQPVWWLEKRKGSNRNGSLIDTYDEKSTDFKSGSDAKIAYDFLKKTAVFDELKKLTPGSMHAFILGIEAGMDTNARKNRTGTIMEETVEIGLKKFIPKTDICKQCTKEKLPDEWKKRYPQLVKDYPKKQCDFLVKIGDFFYAIEVDFFSKGGSKQNETARGYTDLYEKLKKTTCLRFIWITDGKGAECTPIKEYYDGGRELFCLNELYNGTVEKYLKRKDIDVKKKL